eukprot:176337-Alexandrium_andersonii.AAC.1
MHWQLKTQAVHANISSSVRHHSNHGSWVGVGRLWVSQPTGRRNTLHHTTLTYMSDLANARWPM